MATMNGVIEYIDRVKPNAYSDVDKAAWLNRLEGIISLNIMKMEKPITYKFPGDGDKELLVGNPFDDIYHLYLNAMMDFNNQEYSNYNNSMIMFNESYENYHKYYIRMHLPKSAVSFRNVMG